MLSEMKMISIGIVSENKPRNSKLAKIHPAELLSELNGELRSIPVSLFAAGVDDANVEYQIEIKADTSLECEWLSLGENRMTPPDIRRGEQVYIWQYADSEKYYWSSVGKDSNLRRLETVLWAFSNVSDGMADVGGLNHDNAYTIEVSTHEKHITIRTNKKDGEPFAYVVQLNTKDGNYTVQDDVGNYVQLDSAKTTIDLTNKDGTFTRLKEKNMFMYAPDSMYLEAVNAMEMKCTDLIINASKSVSTTTKTHTTTAKDVSVDADAITLTASKTLALTGTSSITAESTAVTITSPTTTCTGLLVCAGISIGSAMSIPVGGTAGVVSGEMTFSTPQVFTGGITTSKITSAAWVGYPTKWDIT